MQTVFLFSGTGAREGSGVPVGATVAEITGDEEGEPETDGVFDGILYPDADDEVHPITGMSKINAANAAVILFERRMISPFAFVPDVVLLARSPLRGL